MAIEDDINFFEKVPTLSMLGRGALRILAIGAESRYVHSGETLFAVGDDADEGGLPHPDNHRGEEIAPEEIRAEEIWPARRAS